MAELLDVITLAEAKKELRTVRSEQDETLALLISAVSERLDDLCGPIVKRTVTELLDGRGVLMLSKRPIASVTTVTEYSGTTGTVLVAQTNGAQTSNDYLLDSAGMLYRHSSGSAAYWPTGSRNVEVEYVAGRFDTTEDVSAKFRMAARIMVKHFFRFEAATGSQTFGAVQADEALGSIATFAVPRAVAELLASEVQSDVALA